MISPFKAVIGGSYKVVEKRLLTAIHIRFGLPASLPEELTARSRRPTPAPPISRPTRLAGFKDAEAQEPLRPAAGYARTTVTEFLTPWPAGKAEKRFLARFETLKPV